MKRIFATLLCSLGVLLPAQAAEEKIGDIGIVMTLAMLQLDLKSVFPGQSDVWWIGHRKCMADTADTLFSSDQLTSMGAKMRTIGKEAVLKDPTWPRFVNLIKYCKTKTDTEIGR